MIVSKYDASGNDFIIFRGHETADYSKLAKKLCQRHNSAYGGADGLIAVLEDDKYDFKWVFLNSDGSSASMCGNGARAVAHFAYKNKLCGSKLTFLSGAGPIACEVDPSSQKVKVILTKPTIIKEQFEYEGKNLFLIDTGVRHIVNVVKDLNQFAEKEAKRIRDQFNANVNYIKIEGGQIFIRTFERGVEAETKACGTGICASFIRACRLGMVEKQAKVYTKEKDLVECGFSEDGITPYLKGTVSYRGDFQIGDM